MSEFYWCRRLMPNFDQSPQIELRLSPGDGLKGVSPCPMWL